MSRNRQLAIKIPAARVQQFALDAARILQGDPRDHDTGKPVPDDELIADRAIDATRGQTERGTEHVYTIGVPERAAADFERLVDDLPQAERAEREPRESIDEVTRREWGLRRKKAKAVDTPVDRGGSA